MNITDRQEEVLRYIVAYIAQHRFSPSSRDIQKHFGFGSQTAAMNHVKALKRKGRITYQERTARTIVVL